VLLASERLLDSVNLYQPNNTRYIYENWRDMAPFATEDPFAPTAQGYANYNAYTLDDFHNWWIDFHDLLLASRPSYDIKMIPVGPMIADMM